jgi:hypothetical protein
MTLMEFGGRDTLWGDWCEFGGIGAAACIRTAPTGGEGGGGRRGGGGGGLVVYRITHGWLVYMECCRGMVAKQSYNLKRSRKRQPSCSHVQEAQLNTMYSQVQAYRLQHVCFTSH